MSFSCLTLTASLFRNANKILALLGTEIESNLIPSHINLTQPSLIGADEYQQLISGIQKAREENFTSLGLEACSIEAELNKVHMFSPG